MNFTQKEQKKCSEIKEKHDEQAKVWRVKMKTHSHLLCIGFASIVENILGEHMEELKEKFELLKSGELYKRFLQNKESDTIK